MKPEVRPVCHGWMHSRRWCSPGLHHTLVHPSLTYRQNLLSSLKTTERHSTLQSTLSWHQSSHGWQCHGVSGSLARDTHDLSPAASRQFLLVLGDIADATCALIAVRAVTTVTQCIDLKFQSWLRILLLVICSGKWKYHQSILYIGFGLDFFFANSQYHLVFEIKGWYRWSDTPCRMLKRLQVIYESL